MADSIHHQTIELLLDSIHPKGDTLLSTFMFGKPGASMWERRYGAELYADRKAYTRTLLFIRQNGAEHLRAISISELWSMVTKFLTENFWLIGHSTLIRKLDSSYSSYVSAENKITLAELIAASPLFKWADELTLYPLVPVKIASSFECERFFLIPAENLNHSHLPQAAAESEIDPSRFPPFVGWTGVTRPPSAWLGIKSPTVLISDKIKAAVLGALALTPLPKHRYTFSGREIFSGRCQVGDSYTVSWPDTPNTPPLMHNIVVNKSDHCWLSMMSELLSSKDKSKQAQIRSLEYFYRAWYLGPRERFPALCMALDSLVNVRNKHTIEAVNYIKKVIGSTVDEARLRLLMRVRGAVIHGAAPDVYESENYAQYYVDYGTDPIRDLELIVAKCLREAIFDGKLIYHLDPNQHQIEQREKHSAIYRMKLPETIIPMNA